jgi:transposase
MEPHRKEPVAMNSMTQVEGPIHLGLDVAKNAIVVGVLLPDRDGANVDRIAHDEASIRRLVDRFPDRDALRVCYEAGPTGFGLYRLLRSVGVCCDVVAPSLIPRSPGNRVKTDKRDARRLATLHRSGQLVAIAVPTPEQEAVRDLCRARSALVYDRRRARQRLDKFLLRHDRVYTAGRAWTARHEQWLAGQRFDDAALRATYAHYRGVASARDAELAAIEAALARWVDVGPFAAATHRLGCYRGIAYLGGLCLASEVFDWRRFGCAAQFMGFTGLVPSEYSSGETVRRGHITKAGNGYVRTQLIESAWSYQHHAAVGADLKRRQQHADPATLARSWAAQQRLCGRFRRLAARKTDKKIVVTAIARELAGFVWAELVAA